MHARGRSSLEAALGTGVRYGFNSWRPLPAAYQHNREGTR